MKYLFKITLLFVMAFTFLQCSDDHAELLDVNGPLSRGITPIEESETNPTLLTDWENCEKVVLNKDGIAAKLPWGDGTSSSGLDSKFCKDIKSADGWTMLFHTFCKQNEDIGLSYMCLYNKFTGYLNELYRVASLRC